MDEKLVIQITAEIGELKKQVADYSGFIRNLNIRNQDFADETIKRLI